MRWQSIYNAAMVCFILLLASCATAHPPDAGQAPGNTHLTEQQDNSLQQPPAQPEERSDNKALGNIASQQGEKLEASEAERTKEKREAEQRPMKKGKNETLVRGIYVTAPHVADKQTFDKLVDLVERSDLNAMVIDIKDDEGRIVYPSSLPLVKEIDTHPDRLPDIKQSIAQLKEKGIYTIARVVVFKDPLLAEKKPEWAIQAKRGGAWRDRSGVAWVNPYHPEVVSYILSIARETAQLGFDEIQFDYVRFPDSPKRLAAEASFPYQKGRTKAEAIAHFLAEGKKGLDPLGVVISADVFGLTTTTQDDMGIGQDWQLISQYVDVISPMMYPSHYAKGSYGLADPEQQPHQTIEEGLEDALAKNKKLKQQNKPYARIRPWYQDFDMQVDYDLADVQAQIKAGQEQGIEEFLLWNPSNRYSYQ
jgi:hypothetical protein